MINTKLQSIIDTKSAIGNAIVNKGGTITSETPFFNYAAQIDGISTGTPQTIFAASDGSKWALTNAVNLTNVSNNVTHDFNYWQPANNSTSDPILNVGTVGANISGNIQLVPVNQVNISQYVNIVINDTTGAKYVGYNGYDLNTNPTPTGNTTFNRWLLNNSASGTVIFANTTITNGGTYNGPNPTANINDMARLATSANYGGSIDQVPTNNGFVFAGGSGDTLNGKVQKFFESNLARSANSPVYAVGYIRAIAINNAYVYVGGFGPGYGAANVSRYHESNLVFANNTASYGGLIFNIAINNGFVYVGGATNQTVQKFNETNLVFNSNSANYNGQIWAMVIKDGYIYIGGTGNQTVRKLYESNLAFVADSPNFGSFIRTIAVNNGYVYAGGDGDNRIQKFYESNLVRISNHSPNFGFVNSIRINNNFIYVAGSSNQTVQKFHEGNLVFVNNTAAYGGSIQSISMNNGFIYAGGLTNTTVQKFKEQGLTPDTQTFYTATKIKE
jgi:uncharacterized protein YggL (DUF469 family)